VAIDETKITANASKHKAMSYGRMQEKETALERPVAELLGGAAAADRAEDQPYGVDRGSDESWAELARYQTQSWLEDAHLPHDRNQDYRAEQRDDEAEERSEDRVPIRPQRPG
jgi:hypothetical protein